MTQKTRLETILSGGIPDAPPHFELVYQIEEAVFGMRRPEPTSSASGNRDREVAYNIELMSHMVEEYDWAAVYPIAFDLPAIGALKDALGDRALVFSFDWDGVFWMPPGDKLMDFVLQLYEHPEDLHLEARRKCDHAKEWVRQMIDAGADFLVLAHDFGFNEGPFVSPAQFGEFVAPYLTEIVGVIHDCGAKALLHSDGDLRAILDQIHTTGIDGYQSVDPQGHMDIRAVREAYPDWILMGNVMTSMMQNTDEHRIRESVDYCMTHGGIGKRYILSTSNCIFHGMPVESYHIMLDQYRRMIASR